MSETCIFQFFLNHVPAAKSPIFDRQKSVRTHLMAEDDDLPPQVAHILRGGLKSRAPTEREIAVRQLSSAGCRHKQVLAS